MLLIGYGNPGRGDDGLGPALVERLRTLDLPGLALDSDYQLTPEMAADLVAHDRVVFADATLEPLSQPRLMRIAPRSPARFTSHGLDPAEVFYLAQNLFAAESEVFVLAIPGTDFGRFHEGLSERACMQLELATELVRNMLDAQNPTALA